MQRFLFLICCLFAALKIFGQTPLNSGWKHEVHKANVFIENKGQFNHLATQATGEILYGVDWGSTKILFGKTGIRYYFLEVRNKEEEHEALANAVEHEAQEQKEKAEGFLEGPNGQTIYRQDEVNIRFVNAQENVQLIGLSVTPDYHNYSVVFSDSMCKGYSNAKGFLELTYENIYPHIDLKYSFHPEKGLKYMFVVHPGGDPSRIEMAYDKEIEFNNQEIHLPTLFGEIIDHQPYSYQTKFENEVTSSFTLSNKSVHFTVGAYRKSEDLIIDPWVDFPVFVFVNWYNSVWECDKDDAGNVYIICGDAPMELRKYSPTGNLLWTYNTPYDYNNSWIGTLAVTGQGISFVTSGSPARLQKISTTGALLTSKQNYALPSKEFWTLALNCTQDQLVVGGTLVMPDPSGAMFTINPANLNITSIRNITTPDTVGFDMCHWDEIRSITASSGGKFYFLTHDSMGYVKSISPNCGPNNNFKIAHQINFDYTMQLYHENKSGICALTADENYLYFNRGDRIEKRDLQTCAIISASGYIGGGNITVPSTSSICDEFVSNSGIALDACGNIYAGTISGVRKFDQAFNQTGWYSTNFDVFDVAIGANGEVIAAGSNFIQTFFADACVPYVTSCCSASICQPQALCVTDDPVTLFVETPGGTWSGSGVNAGGIFNPYVAGVGLHTVIYTLSCGIDSIQIEVSPCNLLEVCQDSTGQLNVYGGVGPYTWQGSLSTTYVPIGSGSTIIPPSGVTLFQVSDSSGIVYSFDISTISSCYPNVCTSFTSSAVSTDISCFGQVDGAFNIVNTGGTAPFLYSTSPNLGSGSSFNQLSAGNYVVTVVDMNFCSNTVAIQIHEPPALSISSFTTNTICGTSSGSVSTTVSGGVGPYAYFWTPGNFTTDNVVGLPIGTYEVMVRDVNHCQITDSVTISNLNQLSLSNTVFNLACFGGANGMAIAEATNGTGPYSFVWSPIGGANSTATNLTAGTYWVQVSDSFGCTDSMQINITSPPQIIIAESIIASDCNTDNGGVSVIASGGFAPYTYYWTPSATNGTSVSNLGAGDTVTIKVIDGHDCMTAETYIIPGYGGISVLASPASISILEGETVVITASGAQSYVWSPSDGLACSTCANTFAAPLASTLYTVTGTNAPGCTGQAQVQIFVTELCGEIYVPTIFSPSSTNSENKQACVYGGCIAELDYSVFDRWGQSVFQTNDQNACWDGKFKGKEMNAGVYAYKLTIKLQNGEYIMRSGNLTLLK